MKRRYFFNISCNYRTMPATASPQRLTARRLRDGSFCASPRLTAKPRCLVPRHLFCACGAKTPDALRASGVGFASSAYYPRYFLSVALTAPAPASSSTKIFSISASIPRAQRSEPKMFAFARIPLSCPLYVSGLPTTIPSSLG